MKQPGYSKEDRHRTHGCSEIERTGSRHRVLAMHESRNTKLRKKMINMSRVSKPSTERAVNSPQHAKPSMADGRH